MALTACTVAGKDIETTFSPTASGNGPTSGTPTTGMTSDSSGESNPGDSSGGSGSDTNTTNDPTGGTSGGVVDEQPANGMYSECAMPGDCVGQNACVTVVGAMGAGGFCSTLGCLDATTCDANPGATSNAIPMCIDNGAGMMVCALTCAGGQTCPGGMQCLALGANMVCA